MHNFNIKFQTNFSDDEENPEKVSFTLTFLLREHFMSLGHYVMFPSLEYRRLFIIPKSQFNRYERRFEELSEKIQLSEKEKAEEEAEEKSKNAKSKNRRYYVSEDEISEVQKLRNVISHSHEFSISGYETTVTLPYKYAEMLQIKDDSLSFIQTDDYEFMIINPSDEWMFNINTRYNSDINDDDTKNFINRIKRAI